MTQISDYVCEDVYNALLPVPNSNDPYVYVDPWTDRHHEIRHACPFGNDGRVVITKVRVGSVRL